MSIQSEAALEAGLIATLQQMDYEYVQIAEEDNLQANFKRQLEIHNRKRLAEHGRTEFTDEEFDKILIYLEGGTRFEKAKKLRDLYPLDTADGKRIWVEFLNRQQWCQNEFQVSNQITVEGRKKCRYDVTILINGLPLVQIELKRRGVELRVAYDQIQRYHKTSYHGLFDYIQLFVISNGVNTRYFANNPNGGYKFTFNWTDAANVPFNELDKLVNHRCTNFGMDKKQIAGDGMVTGYGKIDGRLVFVYAYDFTAHGGSLSETNAAKIVKVQELALKNGAPVIALNDSGGARIQEGVNSLAGYASIFYQNTIASGVIPQISAILGPCAGGACYSPALTDFIFMVKEQSHMFITGPDVVRTVTNEEVGKEELGGAQTHSGKSGVTHFMCDNEEETLMSIRELLSFLPSNNMEDAPLVPCNDDIHRQVEALQTVIPEDPNMPYDIKDIIEPVLDNQYFFEVMPHFAKNVVVGFGRLGGRSVGIVANQPAWLAGVLDIDASDKAARFIRFCDCFNIPLITFEDVPGFLPGTVQEHNGIIRHGAKIVYAYAEATVPKVTLITRKAYGGAYIVMSSKPTGADVNLAYPQAEIAVMGAEGAVNILYRKSAPEEKAEIIKEYEDKFSNPYRAAERGLIDEVIMPRDTRYKLIQALEMCHNKNQSNPPKKHGNMPL
mgnify:CR=1 FL=1